MFRSLLKKQREKKIVGTWFFIHEQHLSAGVTVSDTRFSNLWHIEVNADGTHVMRGDIPFTTSGSSLSKEVRGTWKITEDGCLLLTEFGVQKTAQILQLDRFRLALSFKDDELKNLFQYETCKQENVDTVTMAFIRGSED